MPLLALTATATQRVCSDLQEMLRIPGCDVFRACVNRPQPVLPGLQHSMWQPGLMRLAQSLEAGVGRLWKMHPSRHPVGQAGWNR